MKGIHKKVEDDYSGVGEFIYENGDKYKGEWECGERHGYGIYTSESGTKYDGFWEYDKKNGIFIVYNSEYNDIIYKYYIDDKVNKKNRRNK